MKSEPISLRIRPGTREKADAIRSRFAGYGDNLTDLIHILIDREYARLTRPERPLLHQIESHADAIRSLIHAEAARIQEVEDAAEIADILDNNEYPGGSNGERDSVEPGQGDDC